MPQHKNGMHHPVAVYAKKVAQGAYRRSCCEFEILACKRHLEDLKRQGDPDFPYVFDETRADRILRWFKHCIQVRGVEHSQPVVLQDWQVFDLGCVYGWVHVEDGTRRFSVTYNKRARGNFKSTEKSCQCLYHMCGDALYPPYRPEEARFEREPEVECAAVDREQAKRVYGDAKKIAEASPDIRKRLIIPRSNNVTSRKLGGFMRPLSKDTKNKDSGAPSYFVVDEYHAHQTSLIYDIGKSGFGKRPQPLLDVITTAGEDADTKPCFSEEEYAKKILRGEVRDDNYFAMIRELPDDADPHNEKLWVMPNPCLRYDNDYARYLFKEIRAEHTAAYGSNDADKIRNFLTRRMNQWQASSAEKYMSEEHMRLARAAQIPREQFAELTDGLECWCGFDLGKRIDLSGCGAVFLLPDGRMAIKAQGFMPRNGAVRHEHSDRVPYLHWAEEGHCVLTPGDVTDNSYVADWIEDGILNHRWRVLETDYDGHNATDLAIALNEKHSNEDFCVEISQTCAGQNMAVKGFRELLLSGNIVLEENPLFIWCLGNAIEVTNNYGDVKLSKKHKSDTERIDPVAAVMNALGRALIRRNNPTLSDNLESGNWTM